MKLEKKYFIDKRELFVLSLLLVLVYLAHRHSYLLFHTLAEGFSVFIAFGIFVIAWNTRKFKEHKFYIFLGVIYLFVGALDFIHVLTYPGMNIIHGYGANLPTQIWILARYMESISLLIALLTFEKKIKPSSLLLLFIIIVSFFLVSIFYWQNFPVCFIEGKGLSSFKINSEYVISFILLVDILLLYTKRSKFYRKNYQYLMISFVLTICAEIFFTLYINVYDFSNMVGHFFKIISFYFIYKGVIEFALKEPFIELNEMLITLKNSEAVVSLERDRLKEAINQVKTLKGLLPICANCKKIRDDSGYWKQIEQYISQHSEAEFTHGICPDCRDELYGKFLRQK